MPLIYYIAEFVLCSILWGGIAFKYRIIDKTIKMVLLLLSSILLSQMLETGRTSKIYFLLLSVITFPFMLFSLNMELYIFAVFWAILFI